MPELPEVENIRSQIMLLSGATLIATTLSSYPLRYSLSSEERAQLGGATVSRSGPQRLGRYLLLPLDQKGMLMIHLGMTGAIRLDDQGLSRLHDHVAVEMWLHGKKTFLIYNDPRRFGGVGFLPANSMEEARLALGLGVEPTELIAPDTLGRLYHARRPIKTLLMDNSLVTGIGNIYASEICHEAYISPLRLGNSLGRRNLEALSLCMRRVIAAAIENGGSTLRNYVHVDGSKGAAQQQHRVYARAGQLCSRCLGVIVSAQQSGRTSFMCPVCQL